MSVVSVGGCPVTTAVMAQDAAKPEAAHKAKSCDATCGSGAPSVRNSLSHATCHMHAIVTLHHMSLKLHVWEGCVARRNPVCKTCRPLANKAGDQKHCRD